MASWSTTVFPWIHIWLLIHVKMIYLPIATKCLSMSTIFFKMEVFWVLQLAGKKENLNRSWIYSYQKRQRTSKQDVLHWLLHKRSNWQMVIEENKSAVWKQLPMLPVSIHYRVSIVGVVFAKGDTPARQTKDLFHRLRKRLGAVYLLKKTKYFVLTYQLQSNGVDPVDPSLPSFLHV